MDEGDKCRVCAMAETGQGQVIAGKYIDRVGVVRKVVSGGKMRMRGSGKKWIII